MKSLVSLVAPLVLLCLCSCNVLDTGFRETEARIVVPRYFLYSGFEPLEQWLDTPFMVRYENIRLVDVFDQEPLNEIQYRLEQLPTRQELFFVDSPGISRRQLLWAIAHHYNLSMSLDYDGWQPSAVVVKPSRRSESM